MTHDGFSHSDEDRATTLDAAFLERQTFGDSDLAREVLGLFLKQAQSMLTLIAQDAPVHVRRDAAHTLKGAARAIGAVAVAQCAEAIELSLGTGESRLFDKAMANLHVAVDEVCFAIRQMFPGVAGEADSDDDVARKSA